MFSISPSSKNFGANLINMPSQNQLFTLNSDINVTNIIVAAPTGFQVSIDGITWTNVIDLGDIVIGD
jgi:hypothetical protein